MCCLRGRASSREDTANAKALRQEPWLLGCCGQRRGRCGVALCDHGRVKMESVASSWGWGVELLVGNLASPAASRSISTLCFSPTGSAARLPTAATRHSCTVPSWTSGTARVGAPGRGRGAGPVIRPPLWRQHGCMARKCWKRTGTWRRCWVSFSLEATLAPSRAQPLKPRARFETLTSLPRHHQASGRARDWEPRWRGGWEGPGERRACGLLRISRRHWLWAALGLPTSALPEGLGAQAQTRASFSVLRGHLGIHHPPPCWTPVPAHFHRLPTRCQGAFFRWSSDRVAPRGGAHHECPPLPSEQ